MPTFSIPSGNLVITGSAPDGTPFPLYYTPLTADLTATGFIPGQVSALPQILDDIVLPDFIALGAVGGPTFSTTVNIYFSGLEERNANWTRPRQKWNIGYNIKELADLQDVIDIFWISKGRAFGFLFKDWLDYLSNGAPTKPPTAVANNDQNIGTGDGVEVNYQITKTYTVGSRSHVRTINRPISGTVLVAVNAVAQTEGANYTIDYGTGIITFVVAPPNGHAVTCGYEFRVPVRFDIDSLDAQINTFWLGEMPNIPLIEILE
jgi:uncharacterized protein (TIGR02217 family)